MIAEITKHGPVPLGLLLNVASVIWYASQKDWGRAWYWAAAAQITIAATWWVKK